MPLPTIAYRLIGRFSISRLDRSLHPLLYRWTGGRWILGRFLGCQMLLLTTIGRRSGKARTVALFTFPVTEPRGTWAVIGSRGGSGIIPAWFRNLVAAPEVVVQLGGGSFDARAREVVGDEYEAIFAQAAQAYAGYRVYRAEASHHIPIVVLEPVVEPSPGAATPEVAT